MRLFTVKAFEGQVVQGSVGTKLHTYTLPMYQKMFGAAESFALELNLTDISGTGVSLGVDYYWSNNGTIWYLAGTTVIGATDAAPNSGTFYVPTCNGALGRFGLYWTSSSVQGSATLTVCGRAQQSWM